MPNDVVPALNEEITLKFQKNMMRDRRAARVAERIQNGTAVLADGHEYAQTLGECLSNALQTTLTEENLPDGTMYYNIANRTVKPALMVNYDLVNENAAEIQKIVDNGIGLNAVKAAFPEERINNLMDKIVDVGLVYITEPIVNNTEAFFDDFIMENAKVRSEAGLTERIVRKALNGCCEWCDKLVGVYPYSTDLQYTTDVFRRHEYCRCVVTYENDKKRQNVWTKKTWQASALELANRKDIRGRPVMTKQERQEVIANAEKDLLKKKLRDAGFTSLQADSIYDQALRYKRDWDRNKTDTPELVSMYIDKRIKKKRLDDLKKLGG